MNAEKRGNIYRVKKQYDGKRYNLDFDHKPSQMEIYEALEKLSQRVNGKLTFLGAANTYIDTRVNTLSPATVREYKGMLKRLSEKFKSKIIDDITQRDVQREINDFAKKLAPKTVRNYHGFISSVLADFRPELILHTNLPQKQIKSVYIPNSDDIKVLLDYAYNTPYEVPLLLACASLRRGEICALTMDDIEGNVIHVTKDMVFSEDKEWVIKPPKTSTSVRDVVVPDRVIDAINRNGLYHGHPSNISDWMDRAEKTLGLEHFSIHKLRHFFASEAHRKGVCDADIMKTGGWKTDYVMKSVYRHSLSDNSNVTSSVLEDII